MREGAARLGEQTGCVALLLEGLKTAHRLVDAADAAMTGAMEEAVAKSEALRRAYDAARGGGGLLRERDD